MFLRGSPPLRPGRVPRASLRLRLSLADSRAHLEERLWLCFWLSLLGPRCNRFPEARPHYRPVGLAITCEASAPSPRVCQRERRTATLLTLLLLLLALRVLSLPLRRCTTSTTERLFARPCTADHEERTSRTDSPPKLRSCGNAERLWWRPRVPSTSFSHRQRARISPLHRWFVRALLARGPWTTVACNASTDFRTRTQPPTMSCRFHLIRIWTSESRFDTFNRIYERYLMCRKMVEDPLGVNCLLFLHFVKKPRI